MALVEMDQIFIDRALFERAQNGDSAAKDEIRKELDGMVLYMHALTVLDTEDGVFVTIRQLEGLNILNHVTLHTGSTP